MIIRIREVSSSTNNKAKILFNHDLKNTHVVGVERVKKAKGEININILSITYLREYEKIILKKLKEKISFKIPSIEKKLFELVSILIIVFKTSINLEKEISISNKLVPRSRIADDINEFR